ncbi:hypothetical protein J7I98_40175 [Streptomyces sp. ISL-98]|uniref:hypothetical protein n=1 Tax=Streptomyces sp. ISL-98 TaxID=2819192 RepID=UPI001BEA4C06|nr:hypothetical protein [Streptomyces sp. ISL-98]MBT2511866.1 hypothetical protein [Streptomyces sp. ISL-98]
MASAWIGPGHRSASMLKSPDLSSAPPGEVQRDETIAGLRNQLREATAQVTEVQGKLDALASATANLYENLALKKRQGGGRLVTILRAAD